MASNTAPADKTAEVQVRPKSQITLPAAVVRSLGLREGDRLVVELRGDEPEGFHVRRIRSDYAGALAGIYGNSAEVKAYLEGERESWE